MSQLKRTPEQWEDEIGIMLIELPPAFDQPVTLREFEAMRNMHGVLSIDKKSRTEWLEANGYEPTRENLQNMRLEPKPVEAEEEKPKANVKEESNATEERLES